MANQVFRFYSTAPLIVFHHARILREIAWCDWMVADLADRLFG
jgi:hypothetical protein